MNVLDLTLELKMRKRERQRKEATLKWNPYDISLLFATNGRQKTLRKIFTIVIFGISVTQPIIDNFRSKCEIILTWDLLMDLGRSKLEIVLASDLVILELVLAPDYLGSIQFYANTKSQANTILGSPLEPPSQS